VVSHRVAGAPLDFAALRAQLEVPGDFAAAVLAEAAQAAGGVALPDDDATAIPFVTIDPTGSRDLDQAVHIARSDGGFLVSYAIADVAAFVRPGGAVDGEAHGRGQTLYFPDLRVPLHPPQLSEGAASLLPAQVRPAVLWQITLDDRGEAVATSVRRARVRSAAQLDYPGTQRALDTGDLPEAVKDLETVGRLRLALARERHAIDLDLPEQLVTQDASGGWTISLRQQLPVERYNAEISLLTGMCAARLMLDARIGVLRTVPPPDPGAVASLHRAAAALGITWHHGVAPGDVLSTADRGDPRQVAFVEHAVALLRGAGYTVFDGAAPAQQNHCGIGAPYAHVTAPLRRLVDRYATEICVAVNAGRPVPEWVRSALPALPEEMAASDHLAHEVDRAVVDMTEAWLLRGRVGDLFDAVVIDADEHAGTVLLDEPAVRARCSGSNLPVGGRVRVRLEEADVEKRLVRFASAR
jgi:exoribonuclease R